MLTESMPLDVAVPLVPDSYTTVSDISKSVICRCRQPALHGTGGVQGAALL
jgi:hypothetical protein